MYEHMDYMRRAMKVKGKGRINVLVPNNEKVNSLENVFEEAPGCVRILLPKTRLLV